MQNLSSQWKRGKVRETKYKCVTGDQPQNIAQWFQISVKTLVDLNRDIDGITASTRLPMDTIIDLGIVPAKGTRRGVIPTRNAKRRRETMPEEATEEADETRLCAAAKKQTKKRRKSMPNPSSSKKKKSSKKKGSSAKKTSKSASKPASKKRSSKKKSSAKKRRISAAPKSKKKSGSKKKSRSKKKSSAGKSTSAPAEVALDGSTLLPEPMMVSDIQPKMQHPMPVEVADEDDAKTESPPSESQVFDFRPPTDAMDVDHAAVETDSEDQKLDEGDDEGNDPAFNTFKEDFDASPEDKLNQPDSGLWGFFGPGVALAGSVAAGAILAYQNGVRPW